LHGRLYRLRRLIAFTTRKTWGNDEIAPTAELDASIAADLGRTRKTASAPDID